MQCDKTIFDVILKISLYKNEYKNTKMNHIISGVGVRKYYRRMGYNLRQTYMVKEITWWTVLTNYFFLTIVRCFSMYAVLRIHTKTTYS